MSIITQTIQNSDKLTSSIENFYSRFKSSKLILKTFLYLLNDGRINWTKFTTLLCSNILKFIRPLTDKTRKEAFVVDDSMYLRENAKRVEMAATQFDHAKRAYKKGFRLLQLGWTDGNTFLPVNSQRNRGHRTIGELFFLMVSELSDLTFAEAISYLVSLFKDALENEEVLEEEIINEILSQFITKLPTHYKNRFLDMESS